MRIVLESTYSIPRPKESNGEVPVSAKFRSEYVPFLFAALAFMLLETRKSVLSFVSIFLVTGLYPLTFNVACPGIISARISSERIFLNRCPVKALFPFAFARNDSTSFTFFASASERAEISISAR